MFGRNIKTKCAFSSHIFFRRIAMLNGIVAKWGLIAVFTFMFSNGFISTPPSELVLSIAGALTITNQMDFWSIFIVALTANYLGATILYIISRWKGKIWYDKLRYSRFFINRKILNKLVPSSEELIRFFGNQEWLIFACRFLPFIRSIISVPAGITKMNFGKYTIYTLAGIMIWTGLWIWSGKAVAQGIIRGNYQNIVIFFVLFFISGMLGRTIRKYILKS